jgi:two-component sensor histidine kinase
MSAFGVKRTSASALLQAIAKNELAPYSQADERRVQIYGPPLLLAPDVAQAIAMTLHELATNAAKYGAPQQMVELI